MCGEDPSRGCVIARHQHKPQIAPNIDSEWLDDDQNDNGGEKQYRDFIEPAIPDMTPRVVPKLKTSYQLCTPDVIATEQNYQAEFDVHPGG